MISKTSMREGELCEPLLGENSPQPVAARSSFALCAGTAPEGVRRQALSVSRYLEITNNVLKRCGTAVVVGEISEIKRYSHLYFKVKDEGGTVDCLMFAFALKEVPFTPEVGMEVILVGESSLYAKNGSFKLLVKHMYLSGAGSLMAQIERLRRKLEEEGLFSGEKRPLPRFIRRVGLVTSREGAVLHDIRRTLWRRNPLIESVLFETLVQGAQAPAAIVAALDRAYAAEGIDVIVLARGGGSLEDLLPFFEESVVRKVAASPVPIISAIGHEPDVALTDYAADVRAATPTAAEPTKKEMGPVARLPATTLCRRCAARRPWMRDHSRAVFHHTRVFFFQVSNRSWLGPAGAEDWVEVFKSINVFFIR